MAAGNDSNQKGNGKNNKKGKSFGYKSVVEDVEEAARMVRGLCSRDAPSAPSGGLNDMVTASVESLLPAGGLFWAKYAPKARVGGDKAVEAISALKLKVWRIRDTAQATGTREERVQSVAELSRWRSDTIKQSPEEMNLVDDKEQLQSKLSRYMASASQNELLKQHVLSGNGRAAMRVVNCAKPGAPLWLMVMPVEQELELSDDEMVQALRHQHGLQPCGIRFHCKCGDTLDAGHSATCKHVRGPASYKRHQAVVTALANAADAHCGVTVSKSPPISSVEELLSEERRTRVIPDVSFHSATSSLVTDVTALYGDAKSHTPPLKALEKESHKGGDALLSKLSKHTTQRCNQRAKDKRDKYLKHVMESGESMKFEAFVMESHGWLHDSARDVLLSLADSAFSVYGVSRGDAMGYLQRRVAVALQRGNAWLARHVRQTSKNSGSALVATGALQPLSGAVMGPTHLRA